MNTKKLLPLACVTVLGGIILFAACTKNTNPSPPVHDTVTVVKNDTFYTPKPDSTVNLTKGLLVYLPFSGNIADSSGNNNPTTAIGTPLTYDTHGWANNAFGAAGDGTEVVVTNNGSIKFDTAFSVSFGFMVNDTNATQVFVSLVNPANGYGATFDLGLTLPANNYFDVGVGDINNNCSAITTHNVVDTTHWTPVPGSWYNCVSIYHEGTIQIYINGALIDSKTSTLGNAINCSSAQLVIGGWWNGDKLSMNGKLDNVRLYNRVLTPHEITALSSNYQVGSNSVRPTIKTN